MSTFYQKVMVLSLLSITALGFFSFKDNGTATEYTTNYFRELNEAVIDLDKAADGYRYGRTDLDVLRNTLRKTRLSYKKAEFYLAFHYSEYVTTHINGAPLLQIEKEVSRPYVVNPEGLQVLDELIFSDEAEAEKVEISAQAKRLKTFYGSLYQSLIKQLPGNENDIEAMRMQLVRIFTLGLTGFDTPGSLNAMPEAAVSLEAMNVFFNENYKNLSEKQYKDINALFTGAVAYLDASPSFEEFDRLEMLTRYIDPLYKKLGELKADANVDLIKYSTGWDPASKSIFAVNFLNPYYFTDLKEEENSAELKALGKSLFYDTVLSSDGKTSCATCHQPEKAFTDGVPKSLSNVQGKTVLRNAPTLLNAVYADRYFYDLRAFTLEQQAEHVIFNPDEFNTAYSAILKKLNSKPEYELGFKKAFGEKGINREKFSKALASYVLSLNSFNSPFDKFVRGESSSLPQDVKNGFNLFMGKANCATCHFAPTFSGLVPPFYNENESEILGVLETPNSKKQDSDSGRYDNKVLSEQAWIYEKSFKTITVRNAGLTAPYFHNGGYETLEEVIDFYNEGGGQGKGYIVQNQTLPPDVLNLTEKEKKDLIAFIHSLSDNSATKN